MIRRFLSISGLLLAASAIAACGGVDSDESQPVVTEPDQGMFTALFSPSTAQVPFPNNIYFSGTTDGTLNIPASPANPALSALNELDGFSTTASIYVDTTDSIAADSLVYGQTVFLFNTSTFAVVPATVARADFANGTNVIEIVPAAPLAPATTYAGFVTKNVQSTVGDALQPDETFQALVDFYATGATAAEVESGAATTGNDTLDALYAGGFFDLFQLADGATIGAENLAVAWGFTTQSIGASLGELSAAATAQTNAFVPVLRDPANPGAGIRTAGELLMPASDLNGDGTPDIGTQADVYVGMIELPYYKTDPMTGNWVPNETICAAVVAAVDALSTQPASTTSACPTPALQQTLQVPVLLTIPNASSASAGAVAGVSIYQHGITRNRTDALAVAGALADAGRAVISVDLPLHGITDTSSLLYSENLEATLQAAFAGTPKEGIVTDMTELTFDLDVDGDGSIDSSGANFINLQSLLTTRDSMRQAAANLLHIEASIPTIDYNNDGVADFTMRPVSFVGQSLGAITGTVFLANSNAVDPAVLSVPGGVLTQLLTNSATFAPVINDGLAENGVVEGTRFYEEFLRNAQTVVDGGDPINYGAAANDAHAVLMHEVIGDQVVPNSSTEALASAMGLTQVTGSTTGTDVDGLVRFIAGSHGSLLDPSTSEAATTEMQTQMANFIFSGGDTIVITDGSVVDQ